MAKESERNLARQLFIDTNLNLNDIAIKVKVSAKTVGKWAEQEKWADQKAAKHTSLPQILAKKYKLLNKLVEANLEKQEAGELTNADIDAEHKLSMSIRELQGEETLSDYITAFTALMKFAEGRGKDFQTQLASLTEDFLLVKAKELA